MWIYYHELFHRDKPALLEGLKRKTSQVLEHDGVAEDVATKPIRRSHSVTFPSDGDALFRRSASDSPLQSTGTWCETLDESSGQVYYWNTVTGQCQWESPPHWTTEDSMRSRQQLTRGGDYVDDGSSSEGSSEMPTSKRMKRGHLHGGWRGEDGRDDPASACSEGVVVPSPSPFDRSSSVDLYYSEDSGNEATSSQWEELQVSTDDLGSLQRALYERHTAPALVACVTFALRTTPRQHQKPSRFLSAVREKLNSHSELWRELQKYREALEPSRACCSQWTSSEGMYVLEGQADGASTGAEDDACMMREFMAFVVTRLQYVRDMVAEHSFPMEAEHKKLLNECLRLWWKLASRYM